MAYSISCPRRKEFHVFYIDIGDKFLTADGTLTTEIMGDGLHPTAKGYQIWADAIIGQVKTLMK